MDSTLLRDSLRAATSYGRRHIATLFVLGTMLTASACTDDAPADPIRVAAVVVSPRLTTARVGASQQLTASANNASGTPMSGESVTWASSEPSVATVSSTGLVTFVGSGSTAIIATVRGTTGFATIVSEANVSTVAMSVATLNLPLPQTFQLLATPQDNRGVALFRPVTWTTSAPTIATVSNTGLVTSLSAGTVTITATSESRTGTTQITVVPPAPVGTVSLSPGSGFLPTTVPVPFVATLRDANGGTLTDRVISWSSSNTAVATVSATGVVTALTTGTVTITATSEGRTGSATFTALRGLRNGPGVVFGNPTDASAFFAVYVPAGSTSFLVTLRGGTGDPDLYVYRPGQNTPACASENGGANVVEDCNLANPLAGVWVVEVYAYETHANTTIAVTVTPTPP